MGDWAFGPSLTRIPQPYTNPHPRRETCSTGVRGWPDADWGVRSCDPTLCPNLGPTSGIRKNTDLRLPMTTRDGAITRTVHINGASVTHLRPDERGLSALLQVTLSAHQKKNGWWWCQAALLLLHFPPFPPLLLLATVPPRANEATR